MKDSKLRKFAIQRKCTSLPLLFNALWLVVPGPHAELKPVHGAGSMIISDLRHIGLHGLRCILYIDFSAI